MGQCSSANYEALQSLQEEQATQVTESLFEKKNLMNNFQTT